MERIAHNCSVEEQAMQTVAASLLKIQKKNCVEE
jgi:hypothetical protein